MPNYTVRLESRPEDLAQSSIDEARILDAKEFTGCEVQRWDESYLWVVRDESGQAVGYAAMRYLTADKCGYFSRAAVLNKHRRRGLHRRLVRARINFAKRQGWQGVITYTAIDNLASANSLMALGFRLYSPAYRYVGKDFLYFVRMLPKEG